MDPGAGTFVGSNCQREGELGLADAAAGGGGSDEVVDTGAGALIAAVGLERSVDVGTEAGARGSVGAARLALALIVGGGRWGRSGGYRREKDCRSGSVGGTDEAGAGVHDAARGRGCRSGELGRVTRFEESRHVVVDAGSGGG